MSAYPDHTRVLQLLWRGEEEPSPRSGLTVSRIVDAAVEVADEEGLAALSMRVLAARLGVGAMSLYTYVPGREELVPLMVERVHGELPTSGGEDLPWRARLEAIAHDLRGLARRHPWLVEIPVTRPVLGPNVFDRYEHELGALEGIGLDDLEMDATLDLIHGHVTASVRRGVEIRRDADASGMSDDEWWSSVLPTLTRVLADRSYPIAGRVGEAIGAPHSDLDLSFAYGLARILDGIEALVARRR
jgi:AcrR family transcriptional regulator